MTHKKREKFIELAEKRMNSAIKCLRLIGNLSNRKNYDYTSAHATEIIDTLDAEIKNLKRKFASEGSSGGSTFKFKKR